MSLSCTLRQSVESWDNSLSSLLHSISVYLKNSSLLFSYLDNDIEEPKTKSQEDCMSLGDALQHIENRLGTIQTAQKDLKSVMTRLQSYRNMSEQIVPFNRLPPEILSQIILFGLESDYEKKRQYELFMELELENRSDSGSDTSYEDVDEDDPDYEMHFYKDPLPFSVVFSHVCRRWRNVALSTARAWTVIDFHKPMECVEEYLIRSRQCPLDIIVDFGRKSSIALDEMYSKVGDILPPYTLRIASLDIKSRYCVYPTLLLAQIIGSKAAFRPRRLNLTTQGSSRLLDVTSEEDGIEWSQVYLGFMEAVQELDLTNAYLPWDSLAYHNLTSLRLSSICHREALPTTAEVYTILSASPNLESLKLENFQISAAFTSPIAHQTPITLSRLHTLTISLDEDLEPNNFEAYPLLILHTPSLVRLTLHRLLFITEPLLLFASRNIQVSGGVQRAKSAVKYLQIIHCHKEEKAFKTVIADMPNIVDLGLKDHHGFTEKVLKSLKAPSKSSQKKPALPHLHTLRLVLCSETVTAKSLQDMVSSRRSGNRQGISKIRKLVLIDCPIMISSRRIDWFFDNVDSFFFRDDIGVGSSTVSEDEEET